MHWEAFTWREDKISLEGHFLKLCGCCSSCWCFLFCVCYCCTLFSIVNVNMIMIKEINLNFKQECKTRSTMSFSWSVFFFLIKSDTVWTVFWYNHIANQFKSDNSLLPRHIIEKQYVFHLPDVGINTAFSLPSMAVY